MANDEIKKKMTEFYNGTDQYYQRLIGHFEELERSGLKYGSVNITKIAATKHSVLDCGCGSGSLSIYLSRKFNKKTYGLDLSAFGIQRALELAEKAHADCEFKVADIENEIPFEDNFFDVVFMLEVLEHLVYPEKAIKEVSRVLKKGGLFVLVTPNLFIRSSIPQMIKKASEWPKMLWDKNYLPKTLMNPKFDVTKADSDAVYLTNAVEIRRMIHQNHLKIIKGSYIRCIFVAEK